MARTEAAQDDGEASYTSGRSDDPGNAAALLAAGGGWDRMTLSFSFAAEVPDYYRSGASERDGFVAMSEAQQDAVRAALAQIEKVTAIHFVEDRDRTGGPGDLVFGTARLPDGVGGWGYVPQSSSVGGDVWLSTAFRNNAEQAPGSVGFARLLHEIGHALGLKHSGDYDTTGKHVDGPFLPAEVDNRQYTIMAYDPHPAYSSTRPSTPLAFDIAALQQLYGVNTQTAAGDSVYRWAPDKAVIAAIWDAGGHDRLDAANHAAPVTLDLRPGWFSSVGLTDAGGPGRDNIAIAFGVTIEDATGGAGADRLTGNAADNRLDGGSGADTLDGGAGDDTILGGAGDDLAVFSGMAAEYRLHREDDWVLVEGPDGVDRLGGVERIAFDDWTGPLSGLPQTTQPPPTQPPPTQPPAIEPPLAEPPPAGPAPSAPVRPRLSADDAWIAEGQSGRTAVTVTLRLDRPSDEVVDVDWLTWAGTARKGEDYVGAEGTAHFAVGATTATVTVRVLGDRAREGDERFEIRFRDVRGAEIDDDGATVTIRDDDGRFAGLFGDRGNDTPPLLFADSWLF